jgi:hypothetical protein
MMDKDLSLNIELLRQLSLINFDRSKTLMEQTVKSDRLGSEGQFQPLIDTNRPSKDTTVAYRVFEKIKKEINKDSYWVEFWKWGTDEDGLLESLKTLKNKNQYDILLKLIHKNFPESVGLTIIQFLQQQEFSVAQDPFFQELNRDVNMASEIQYQKNDKWLIQYQNILQKFNPYEKYSYESVFDPSTTIAKQMIPPYTRELLHVVLPVSAVLVAIATGGIGTSLGYGLVEFSLELLDAAIYATVDGDIYMAGLGMVFALVPGFTLLAKYLKNMGIPKFKKFLEKLGLWKAGKIGSESLSSQERQALNEFIENQDYYVKLALKTAMKNVVTKTLMTLTKNVEKFLEFLLYLVKKSLLPANFLTQAGLVMGGGFMTWDAIASGLGVCRSFSLQDLEGSENKILSLLGKIGGATQRFAERCDTEEKEKLIDDIEKQLSTLKDIVVMSLEQIIKSNLTFSEKNFKNTFMYEVVFIQYVLKKLGIKSDQKVASYSYDSKNMILNFQNAEEISSVKVYSVYGREMASKNNDEKTNILVDMSKLQEGVYIVNITLSDDTKRNFKIFSLKKSSPAYNLGAVNSSFKWGYYDKYTENVIKKYQKNRGLNPDGVCGNDTLESLLEDSKKFDKINNYGNISLDSKSIKLAIEQASSQIEKNQLEWEKKNESQVTKEEVQEELNKQKGKKIKEITDDLNDLEFDENMLNMVSKKSDTLIKN